MISYGVVSKRHFNLVPIIISASLGKIRRKVKYSKYIRNFLYALCGVHPHNDPTRPLLEFISYFAMYETYQEIWKEADALDGGTLIPRIN